MRLTDTSWNRQAVAVCVALVAMTWVIYGQVTGFRFLNFDDPSYITANLHVQQGLTWANVGWAFTTGTAANWHPLTWLSHMADVTLFGTEAGGHHATSAILHAVNSVLVFLLLHRATRALWPSALVAALFTVHPLHVESVAWVSERKDVLSMFFMLLTLAVHGRGEPARRPAALVLYSLGLMAKPMLVSLPLLMLITDRWPLGRTEPWRVLLREKVPFFLLALASCLVTILVQRRGGAMVNLERLPVLLRLGNVPIAYVKYLVKMVWPVALAPLYPLVPSDIRLWRSLLALVLLAVLTVAAYRVRRDRPYFLAGWLWFLVSLVPVIGIVQVGSQSMADRYTYLPLLGPFLALAWAARDLRLQPWMTGLLLVPLVAQARVQTGYWRDSVTLFRREREVAADNIVARNNLGHALLLEGRTEEAIEEYRAAIAMNPAARLPQIGLARALAQAGRQEEALGCYRRWLEGHPEDYQAVAETADLLVAMGRLAEAVPCYESYLGLEPQRLRDDPDGFRQLDRSQDTRMRLGLILRKLGREAEAVPYFQAAARLNGSNPVFALNLAISLAASGQPAEAARWFRRVLTLQPGNADAQARLKALEARPAGASARS